MFSIYKKDLEKLSKPTGWLRFNVIEYTCSFPRIDPYEMAAVLRAEGIKIFFDDTSISREENRKKERKVTRASDAIKRFVEVKKYEEGGSQDE